MKPCCSIARRLSANQLRELNAALAHVGEHGAATITALAAALSLPKATTARHRVTCLGLPRLGGAESWTDHEEAAEAETPPAPSPPPAPAPWDPPAGSLRTVGDVVAGFEHVIREVGGERMEPNVGRVLLGGLRGLAMTLADHDLEQRLDALEEALGKKKQEDAKK